MQLLYAGTLVAEHARVVLEERSNVIGGTPTFGDYFTAGVQWPRGFKSMRVLVIEDDVDIATSIRAMLAKSHYAVDLASDGDMGLERLLGGTYDVAIVDIVLPKRDGFSICRAARAEKIATPLIVLSARDGIEDRIRGLDAGADDYLIKPFSWGELAARVRALVRRGDRPPQTVAFTIGSLVVDPAARTASVAGRPLQLGLTEFRLLEYFARHHGMTLSRTQILERLWDYDFQGSSNIVDVYVGQLRRKLKALGATAALATVWGIGYKLVATTSNDARFGG